MTNGAGFIALAALIFGKWRPYTAFAGAMLFGFTRALRRPPAVPRGDDRRLRHPERVLAGAALRRDDHRRRRSRRAGRGPGRRRRALRAITVSDRSTSTGRRSAPRRVEACTRAYAPYSRYPVGVAGLVDDGRVLTACNVENASYGAHPVRRVRARVGAARHRRRRPGRGGLRRRPRRRARALRAMPAAAPRARRPRAAVQRAAASASCSPTRSGPDHLRPRRELTADERHRPDPRQAGRRPAQRRADRLVHPVVHRRGRAPTSRPPPC